MSGRSRPKRVLAVDWDAHTLRVVHAHLGKRGVSIDRLLSVAIPAKLDITDPKQMGLHIRRTLAQEGINTKNAIVDIPRDQVILNTLSLPTTQPDELPGMVEIQIAKELPFPVTDAVIDFAIGTPAEDDEVTGDVLVAAVRREQLEQYEATFAAAGLKLDRVGLRPYANKVACCEFLKHAMPERVVFIDVRPTFMEIDVLRDSALTFSRSASVTIPPSAVDSGVISIRGGDSEIAAAASVTEVAGSSEAPVGSGVIASLVMEVARSIEAYRASDLGAVIDHVVVGGDVGVEEALAEAIARRLDLTTEIYNPASAFGWEPDEGAGASAFSASLGLVLGHADEGLLHFDFLHPKETVSVAKQRLRKAPMVAAVVALFAVAGGVGLAEMTRGDREHFDTLGREIQDLRSRRGDNKKFLGLVEEIETFDKRQIVWVDALYDVLSLLPSNREMVLGQVDMDQDDARMTLKTRTKRADTPTDVMRKIEEFKGEGWHFKVSMGPQTSKKRERYPFSQELRIEVVLEDGYATPGFKRTSRG